jgi:hypothetical protein
VVVGVGVVVQLLLLVGRVRARRAGPTTRPGVLPAVVVVVGLLVGGGEELLFPGSRDGLVGQGVVFIGLGGDVTLGRRLSERVAGPPCTSIS